MFLYDTFTHYIKQTHETNYINNDFRRNKNLLEAYHTARNITD
jgi:hypothetical protein